MSVEDTTNTPQKILFVDDEANILKSLQRQFVNSEFSLLVAGSAREGLEVLAREQVAMVITDYKMPEMDGLQFLKIVKEKHPSVSRAILSGFVEQSIVFKALVKGLASVYFSKPWEYSALSDRIRHIFHIRGLLRSPEIRSLINTIEKLPMLPNVYQEFLFAVNQEKSAREIADIINRDVSLSAKLLQVANSAFFGGNPISSLERALLYLGLNAIKDLVLSISISNSMPWTERQKRHLREISFHSAMVNLAIHELYRLHFHAPIPENYSSVGVTHDIGKIIQLQFFNDAFEAIHACLEQNPEADFDRCEQTLGLAEKNHSLVGAYFLDLWNLPETLIEVALFHHRPQDGSSHYRELLDVCHAADGLVNYLFLNRGKEVADLAKYLQPFPAGEQLDDTVAKIRRAIDGNEQ